MADLLFKLLILMPCIHVALMWNSRRRFSKPIKINYAPNKTVSPLEYQVQFCLRRCNNGTLQIIKFEGYFDFECVNCFCQRPACEVYNNCCPDTSVPYDAQISLDSVDFNLVWPRNDSDDISKPQNHDPKLKCDYVDFLKCVSYVYISSCKLDYVTNQTVIDLCETEIPLTNETMETFFRVIDLATQVVYKNLFCALCNHITHYVVPQSSLHMNHLKTVLLATSEYDYFKTFLIYDEPYNITFPSDFPEMDCYNLKYGNGEDKRGAFEKTELNGSDVLRACKNLSNKALAVVVRTTGNIYDNLFCAIYDTGHVPQLYKKIKEVPTTFDPQMLPFSLLLTMRENKRTPSLSKPTFQKNECTDNEWLAPDAKCLQLHCAPGRTYRDGNCTVNLNIKGIHYFMPLRMEPLPTGKVYNTLFSTKDISIKNLTDLVVEETASLISGLNEGFSIGVFAIKETGLYPLVNRTESLVFLVDLRIVAQFALSRDEFESKVIGTFFNTTVHLDYSLNGSLKLQSCYRFKTWEKSQVKILENRFFSRFDKMKFSDYQDQWKDALKITHLLLCPHVRFNRSQYELIYNTSSPAYNITLKIDLNIVQLYINDYNEFSKIGIDENDVLKVCRDLLEIKLSYIYQDLRNSEAYKEIPRPQNILTIACVTASITCLSLTLLTYCMFGELRTEAGVNNMFLSSSVFMAQLSLLAAANAPESSALCKALGMITHFLWLWMFSWSFICSYHMFKVFAAKTRPPPLTNSFPGLWKRILMSLAVPSTVISSTAVFSYLKSNGKEIGYGNFECFLNSVYLVGLTVVGPLSVVTLCNIVFFAITVYNIYVVRSLQSSLNQVRQQNDWFVYARLSSVTGAFWAVAIVSEALDNNVLRFIYIVLNGLQGVAIFLSFVCNTRVLRLYRDLCKPK